MTEDREACGMMPPVLQGGDLDCGGASRSAIREGLPVVLTVTLDLDGPAPFTDHERRMRSGGPGAPAAGAAEADLRSVLAGKPRGDPTEIALHVVAAGTTRDSFSFTALSLALTLALVRVLSRIPLVRVALGIA